MPRSFLVKKHINSAKKPNYSELESPAGKVSFDVFLFLEIKQQCSLSKKFKKLCFPQADAFHVLFFLFFLTLQKLVSFQTHWTTCFEICAFHWSHDSLITLAVFFFSSVHHTAHLQGSSPVSHPPARDPEPGGVQPHHSVDYQQLAAISAPQWPFSHLWIPLIALRHLL